jgi:hypothetical protein
MAVVTAAGGASRFRRSSSAGAWHGLTPRRHESGEVSRNGRVSKRGDRFTRKCLFEAANAIFCRNLGGPRLRDWAKAIAARSGPRKARVALARKLAVTLHAMWRTDTPFREAAAAWEKPGTTLAASMTDCVQPGRAARVRSLPGMRHRPRTPLRSTRP